MLSGILIYSGFLIRNYANATDFPDALDHYVEK